MNHFACHDWSKIQTKLTTFQGVLAKKQPKMTVSAGTKTFKNLKLENYKSDIAKTCPLFTTLTPFIY